jgi:hypothetical protein
MLRRRAALVVTRIHHRSHSSSSSHPSSSAARMKLSFSALAAAVAGSGTCLQFAPTTVAAWTPSVSVPHRSFASVVSFPTSSRLQSTVAPDEAVATTPALTHKGNALAEGTVVSFFQGGLVAVRVDDDEILSQTVSTSTNAAPRVANKSSIGKL